MQLENMENKEKLDQDGYVILRNFLNPQMLNNIKQSCKLIFEKQFERFGYPIFYGYNEDEIFKNNMVRLFNEHPDVFQNCGKLIQTGCLELYKIPSLHVIKEALFNLGIEYPFMCTRPVLFFNHPALAKTEEYYKAPLHQDWPSMESSLNSLVVWVPLVNVTEQNGSIILFPGSHKNGVLPYKSTGGFAEVEYEGKSIQPELNIGDIAIFSTLLVHKSGDIKNDTIRWSCHFRYTDMLSDEFIERGYPNPYQYKPITKNESSIKPNN